MSEREYELYPEPTPEEREALIRAIERHLAGSARTPAAYGSAWRERAILEAVGLAPAGLAPVGLAPAGLAPAGLTPVGPAPAGVAQATARPRRSPGASRA